MRLSRVLLITAVMASFMIGCSRHSTDPNPPRSLSNYEKGIVESGNDFGIELFKQVAANNPDSNICVSPLSVAMALGMTYNGARTTTKEAMDSVLDLTGMDIAEVNQAYQSLIDLLVNLDPVVQFELANSIWYRNSFDISQDFVDLNRDYFYAEINPMDFGDPTVVDIINGWVNDQTHGKIEEIIDPPISPNTVMYLINAIYFLADWKYQFDPEETYASDFYINDDETSSCNMMSQFNTISYVQEQDGPSVVRLPYGNGLYEMVLLRPAYGQSVDEFIAGLDSETLEQWLENTSEGEVDIRMPKFEMKFEDELKNELSDMGMGIAFTPNVADFTGMKGSNQDIKDLLISKVIHKTFIRVDEDGTEAAAVTAVEIEYTSEPGYPTIMFNRPFVFMIVENHSGTILFTGRMNCPQWPE